VVHQLRPKCVTQPPHVLNRFVELRGIVLAQVGVRNHVYDLNKGFHFYRLQAGYFPNARVKLYASDVLILNNRRISGIDDAVVF